MKTPLLLLVQQAVQQVIGSAALLFPFPQHLKLGDFGYYRDGYFRKCGNLFPLGQSSFAPEVQIVPEEEMLLTRERTLVGETANWVDESGRWRIRKDLYAQALPAFALCMQGVSHRSFVVENWLSKIVQQLIWEGRWEDDYRIVWQLTAVEKLSFAWTDKAQEKLAIAGTVQGPYISLLSQQLEVVLESADPLAAGHLLKPCSATLSANLLRYDPTGMACMQTTEDGLRMDDFSSMQDTHFFLDNTSIS